MPAGLALSVVSLKPISFVSLVMSTSAVVTLNGRPINFTLAGPRTALSVPLYRYRSVSLPCSTAARSMLIVTNGAATSSVANCDDVHSGPLPASARAITAVFHFLIWALAAALIVNVVSVAFAGMTADVAELTPGGLNSG